MPLPKYLFRFVRNPLSSLPQAAYEERIIVYDNASFAMMEGVAMLGTLVRGAEFEWDGRHLPEPLSRVTLRPKGGMPLRVWPRTRGLQTWTDKQGR
jgi:hypothetical protein